MTKDTEALREVAKVLRKRCDRVKFGQVGFYGSEAASFDSKVADMLEALAHPPHPTPVDPVAGGEALREALAWYGEQARLARLIHSEGDAGRHALAEDGGKRALAALKGPAA